MDEYGKISNEDPFYFYLKAYLEIHYKQLDQALLSWTIILQKDPSQILADQLIERLKQNENQILADINYPENFKYYVPLKNYPFEILDNLKSEKEKNISNDKIEKIKLLISNFFFNKKLIIIIFFIFLIFLFYLNFKTIKFKYYTIFNKPDKLLDLPFAPQSGGVIPINKIKGESPKYIFENLDELTHNFNVARNLIQAKKTNLARVILTKIELSNASFEFKERAKLLFNAIPYIELNNFEDNVKIGNVYEQPILYRGAQVLWQVLLKNIKPSKDSLELEAISLENPLIKLSFYYIVPNEKKIKILNYLSSKNIIKIFGIYEGQQEMFLRIRIKEILMEN